MNCSGIIYELTAIAVLVYVLFRQQRSLSQIGFSFSRKDIPISILLTVVIYLAYFLCYYAACYGYYFMIGHIPDFSPRNIDFLRTKITVWYLLLMFINPFYEELIARAYTITEVEFLTGKKSLAVIFSVLLQISYHSYQGLFSTLFFVPMFTILSLYYIKWRRITPVILTHMYYDFFTLIIYGKV